MHAPPLFEQSTLNGGVDALTSPSAAIVIGRPPKCGTGSFDLHAQLGPVATQAGQWRANKARDAQGKPPSKA